MIDATISASTCNVALMRWPCYVVPGVGQRRASEVHSPAHPERGIATMDDRSDAADEVAEAVRAVFRAGEGRDFAALRAFHAEDASFSRWSNRPGGALLDVAGAHEEEEAAFGALVPET